MTDPLQTWSMAQDQAPESADAAPLSELAARAAELRAQGQAVPAELADRIREEAAAALEAEMDNLPV
ncbi:MAG: hypothetical protein ACU0A5_16670 [Salipiger marinus]|uniref:hypothetical protein n=1 Tax=Salipiger marinus TaxID=555512 RepID=UPI004057F640